MHGLHIREFSSVEHVNFSAGRIWIIGGHIIMEERSTIYSNRMS